MRECTHRQATRLSRQGGRQRNVRSNVGSGVTSQGTLLAFPTHVLAPFDSPQYLAPPYCCSLNLTPSSPCAVPCALHLAPPSEFTTGNTPVAPPPTPGRTLDAPPSLWGGGSVTCTLLNAASQSSAPRRWSPFPSPPGPWSPAPSAPRPWSPLPSAPCPSASQDAASAAADSAPFAPPAAAWCLPPAACCLSAVAPPPAPVLAPALLPAPSLALPSLAPPLASAPVPLLDATPGEPSPLLPRALPLVPSAPPLPQLPPPLPLPLDALAEPLGGTHVCTPPPVAPGLPEDPATPVAVGLTADRCLASPPTESFLAPPPIDPCVAFPPADSCVTSRRMKKMKLYGRRPAGERLSPARACCMYSWTGHSRTQQPASASC